jgi:MoaA/NifB/PqqE/SkfB family radical SAM enzyme
MNLSFLNLAANISLSNLNLLSKPYKLTFAITDRCNLQCTTCNIWQKKPENELSLSEIEKIFINNKFSWVNLTGGEPYLRSDFVEIIRVINQNNPRLYFLNFTSNGFLTDDILKKTEAMLPFFKVPKFAVGVSINGPPAIDGAIRGNPDSFDHAMETFKGLKALLNKTRYQPFISYTISPKNIGKLQETIEIIRSQVPGFKLTDFHVNPFHFSSHYYGNAGNQADPDFSDKAIAEIDQFLSIYKVPLKPDTWIEKRYLNLLKKYLKKQKTPLPCQALRASCYLDAQGNIYPCAMYNKVLGNLRDDEYKLSKLWKAESFTETKKTIKEYKCPNCWTPCEAYQTILANLARFN